MAALDPWPIFWFSIRAIQVPGGHGHQASHRQQQQQQQSTQGWRVQGPLDTLFFHCDGQHIRQTPRPRTTPPPLSAFSVYYSHGHGRGQFYAVDYDVTQSPNEHAWMPWRQLRYSPNADGSSFLSPAGTQDHPTWGNQYQHWYHQLGLAYPRRMAPQPSGGLNGHINVLLALIFLSVRPDLALQFLTERFQQGSWRWPYPETYEARGVGPRYRMDGGGAVVTIYVLNADQARHLEWRERNGPLFW